MPDMAVRCLEKMGGSASRRAAAASILAMENHHCVKAIHRKKDVPYCSKLLKLPKGNVRVSKMPGNSLLHIALVLLPSPESVEFGLTPRFRRSLFQNLLPSI